MYSSPMLAQDGAAMKKPKRLWEKVATSLKEGSPGVITLTKTQFSTPFN